MCHIIPIYFQGASLLWQPNLVKLYLKLLQEASNLDTLEVRFFGILFPIYTWITFLLITVFGGKLLQTVLTIWNPTVTHVQASAGAVQNLAACQFQPSADVRATVRVEKGLPVMVELLRLKEKRER